jgi:hypothetical protein
MYFSTMADRIAPSNERQGGTIYQQSRRFLLGRLKSRLWVPQRPEADC